MPRESQLGTGMTGKSLIGGQHIVLLILIAYARVTVAQSPGEGSAGASQLSERVPASRYLQEQRAQRLTELLQTLEQVSQGIQERQPYVDQARQKVKETSFNEARITDLLKRASEMSLAPGGSATTKPTQALRGLTRVIDELIEHMDAPSEAAEQGLRPVRGSSPARATTPLDQRVHRVLERVTQRPPKAWSDSASAAADYDQFMQADDDDAAAKASFDALYAFLGSLKPDQLRQAFEEQKNQWDRYLAEVGAQLAAEVKAVGDEVTKAGEELSRLDAQLQGVSSRKQDIDERLFWAAYAMIGLVALVLVALRFYKFELCQELIQKRVLIEVLSMTFLLLVIFILASGERLTNETLGTLLGTIAGYIFGRRIAEPEERKVTGGTPA